MKKKEDLKNHSNIKDTSINPALLHLFQIHDSAFPTGGYAHSFGMETYIQENTIGNKDELWSFCNTYIEHNLASTDAIIVKEAYELAKKRDMEGLVHLEGICHSLKLSPESRKGSMMMGRQFLQTVSTLNDDDLLIFYNEKIKNKEMKGHFPVAYGIYTSILEVNMRLSIETFLYSSVATLVQNAVRAVPLGQMGGVETLYRLLPVIQKATKKIMGLGLDDLANHSIALEIASMKHEYLHSRLFIS